MNHSLEHVLSKVQKPARYTGGEYNEVVKDRHNMAIRYALCFPDIYEIGMSNLGCRILYGLLNDQEDIWCERCFAPWTDMEDQMRKEGFLLYALESGDPIADFDIIGFSLGYEMSYTNVLNMLDLAGIPLRSEERLDLSPLVVAGGTCCYNPEPLAPFVDFFVLGEGEEVTLEYIELLQEAREQGWDKNEFLRAAAHIQGIYVPKFYVPSWNPDGTLAKMAIARGSRAPKLVSKRIVEDFDQAYYPTKPIVPNMEIVHDRIMLELFRGCIRGCRFCQAGYVYRPVRKRSVETLTRQAIETCWNTGYHEITLSSLSSTDYPELVELVDQLMAFCEPRDIQLSLPSLRADSFSMDLVERLQRLRRTGLTFAPEAGTQRLRDAINKNLTEEDLLSTLRRAFGAGWSTVKLYFMLGLPTETDDDVLGIADLTRKVEDLYKDCARGGKPYPRITVSTSCFVPKPHTAFQWEAQVSRDEYMRRVGLLRDAFRGSRNITYNWHDPELSRLEAVFSRGDRRLADVLEKAWSNGARLDAWSECFDLKAWTDAFESCGLDPDFYACRQRERDEVLPWCRVESPAGKKFLWKEREKCYKGETTPDCRTQCSGCGANCYLEGGVCDA